MKLVCYLSVNGHVGCEKKRSDSFKLDILVRAVQLGKVAYIFVVSLDLSVPWPHRCNLAYYYSWSPFSRPPLSFDVECTRKHLRIAGSAMTVLIISLISSSIRCIARVTVTHPRPPHPRTEDTRILDLLPCSFRVPTPSLASRTWTQERVRVVPQVAESIHCRCSHLFCDHLQQHQRSSYQIIRFRRYRRER